MKDDRKSEMLQQFQEMLKIQHQIRALVASSGLKVQLKPDPAEPTHVDQLADAMSVVRINMSLLEVALNEWDHEVNGCEVRTRQMIHADIERDKALLVDPGDPLDDPRSRSDVELNIAYDQMQLDRA